LEEIKVLHILIARTFKIVDSDLQRAPEVGGCEEASEAMGIGDATAYENAKGVGTDWSV
jgi:hypothetical protein